MMLRRVSPGEPIRAEDWNELIEIADWLQEHMVVGVGPGLTMSRTTNGTAIAFGDSRYVADRRAGYITGFYSIATYAFKEQYYDFESVLKDRYERVRQEFYYVRADGSSVLWAVAGTCPPGYTEVLNCPGNAG